MKSPEELYEEQVNGAAKDKRKAWSGMIDEHKLMFADMEYAFKSGIKWSNSNPSPSVMKLVEALEKIRLGSIELAEGFESVPKAKDGHEDPDAYMASCNFRMVEELCDEALADFKKEG